MLVEVHFGSRGSRAGLRPEPDLRRETWRTRKSTEEEETDQHRQNHHNGEQRCHHEQEGEANCDKREQPDVEREHHDAQLLTQGINLREEGRRGKRGRGTRVAGYPPTSLRHKACSTSTSARPADSDPAGRGKREERDARGSEGQPKQEPGVGDHFEPIVASSRTGTDPGNRE